MPDISKTSTPSSGAISLDNIRTALGETGTSAISFNDGKVRGLLNDLTGQISLSQGYSKFLPYGSKTYSVTDSGNWSGGGTRTYTGCSFGTDTDDRIIVGIFQSGMQYGNFDGTYGYASEVVASATIGGDAATCAGAVPFHGGGSYANHRSTCAVFYGRPTGTSGTITVTYSNKGWGGTYLNGVLVVYALYGLSTGNPIEYSSTTYNVTTGGTIELTRTLYPDDSSANGTRLLFLVGSREYLDAQADNYFKVNGVTKASDFQNSFNGGIFTYLQALEAGQASFTANAVFGDSGTNETYDGEDSGFTGIIFAKIPTSAQSVSYVVPPTRVNPPPPPGP